MGLIVPSAMNPEQDDQLIPYDWFVGIDWGSKQHQVYVLDRDRRRVGERVVDHEGASLARLADWLWSVSTGQPQRVAVAIEVPRGAIVEGLLEGAFMSLLLILNNSTASGIGTVWREPRTTGEMPLSWLIRSVPISPVFVDCNWITRSSYG